MVEAQITKTKKLKHEFERIRLNPKNLERIGLKFQEYGSRINSEIEIKVSSLDGEDIVAFSEPTTFSDNRSLPRQIRTINFSLGSYVSNTQIELDIDQSSKKFVTLKMTSSDEMHATGIFMDLVKEIQNYEISGKGVVTFAGSRVGHILLAILFTVLMFLALDEMIKLSGLPANPEIDDPLKAGVGLLLLFLLLGTLVTSSTFANYLIKKLMPSVVFEGDLVDKPPYKMRNLLGYVFMWLRSS